MKFPVILEWSNFFRLKIFQYKENILYISVFFFLSDIHSKGDTAIPGSDEEKALPYRSDADRRRANGPTRRGDPWAHEKEGGIRSALLFYCILII